MEQMWALAGRGSQSSPVGLLVLQPEALQSRAFPGVTTRAPPGEPCRSLRSWNSRRHPPQPLGLLPPSFRARVGSHPQLCPPAPRGKCSPQTSPAPAASPAAPSALSPSPLPALPAPKPAPHASCRMLGRAGLSRPPLAASGLRSGAGPRPGVRLWLRYSPAHDPRARGGRGAGSTEQRSLAVPLGQHEAEGRGAWAWELDSGGLRLQETPQVVAAEAQGGHSSSSRLPLTRGLAQPVTRAEGNPSPSPSLQWRLRVSKHSP